MRNLFTLLAALSLVVCAWGQEDEYSKDECTSLVVGRLASADGSVITSHTCDGVSRTWITVEPAADYGRKAMVDIYKNTRKTAFKGDTTGVRYAGQIPQARHTFAYLNTAYPCLNEKQVAMGETTFSGPDTLRNGSSMFLIEELQRIALQRCDNARDAVRMMGELAEKYGYDYSGDDSVYDDHIVEWDYRNGVIKTQWMGDIIVDKNGNIRRGDRYYSTFYKTDEPRPEPIDPSTLSNPEGDEDADISTEEEEAFEEREESLESTEDAAEDAVVEGENDVQT